jgi:SAM-dependent methyltransferase
VSIVEDQAFWARHWSREKITLTSNDVYFHMDTVKRDYADPLLKPGSQCVEIGCGSGRLSALLAVLGHHLTCLDYTIEALESARRNFSFAQVPGSFIQGDAFAIPLADNSVDGVFSTGLLEHFADPAPILREMTRILRPGGIFFSDIVPDKFSLLRALDFLRPGMGVLERTFTRQEIASLLTEAGLEAVNVFPAGVFPTLWWPLLYRNRRYQRAHGRFVGSTLPFWRSLDNTPIAEKLGFYWFCHGQKPTHIHP